jgi:hypothetical protein
MFRTDKLIIKQLIYERWDIKGYRIRCRYWIINEWINSKRNEYWVEERKKSISKLAPKYFGWSKIINIVLKLFNKRDLILLF